jgi:hypothetical protein
MRGREVVAYLRRWFLYVAHIEHWEILPEQKRRYCAIQMTASGPVTVIWDHCVGCRVCPNLPDSLCPHRPGISATV